MKKANELDGLTPSGSLTVMTSRSITHRLDLGGRLRHSSSLRRVILFIALLIVWQAWVTFGQVNPLLVPSPLDVIEKLWNDVSNGAIPIAAIITLKALFAGVIIGIVAGLLLATFANIAKIGADFMDLLVGALNPLPSVAVLPLAMIWFGLSLNSIIFVVALAAVWPIALNADMGFKTMNMTLRRVADNLGIKGIRKVAQVLLPASLPYLLAGMKLSWAFGWRTVVAAELVFGVAQGGGGGGIGYYINQSRFALDTVSVFAGLVAISLLGVAVDALFAWAQRSTVERWGMRSKSR